jgi:hypothetical protein
MRKNRSESPRDAAIGVVINQASALAAWLTRTPAKHYQL